METIFRPYKTETNNTPILPQLDRYRLLGTNSREIYEKYCDIYGWDKTKSGEFGCRRPLYAENCDADRKNDVWFIFYPNYNRNKLDCIVGDHHVVNLIENNEKDITEIVDPKYGPTKNDIRITFIRKKSGYYFLGVYKVVKNGTTRHYKKISDTYPFK